MVRITDVCEVTKPIASPIRNAYIDFTKMTTSASSATASTPTAATGRAG
jgi:hypothetical protein